MLCILYPNVCTYTHFSTLQQHYAALYPYLCNAIYSVALYSSTMLICVSIYSMHTITLAIICIKWVSPMGASVTDWAGPCFLDILCVLMFKGASSRTEPRHKQLGQLLGAFQMSNVGGWWIKILTSICSTKCILAHHFIMHVNSCLRRALVGIQANIHFHFRLCFLTERLFTLENTLDGCVFKTLNQEPLDSQRTCIRANSQCVSDSTMAQCGVFENPALSS